MSKEKMQGGAMGGVDDLYREVILDHFKSPKNKGRIEKANAESDGLNPLCGDQIHISAIVENGKVKSVKYDGHGCAISQSAASIMTQVIKGKAINDVYGLSKAFKKIFGIDDKTDSPEFSIDDLGDSVALEGVKKYPVRIKCAILSWNTLLESLENYKKSEAKNGRG